ncbi:MAG: bifunctional diaminohydroxyphosphoribosylaminopyrimidine deaminase/5-amino-6-(5-phosphoribosylamino)uracil reductase RibD [Myxococcota bacterium]
MTRGAGGGASRSTRPAAATALDERMMRLALRLASRGDGRTHPNPSVGAVVYRGDRILGRGTTRPVGGSHAEVVAIAAARRRHGEAALRGASIAVTLEPCSFVGRTGACTQAILDAGLGRVVGGCRDPHERVSGRGFARLRRAGLTVVSGVLGDECRHQHRGFRSVCERGRPHVTLKLATTLDGRIATATGESRWITGEAARAFVHRLRDASDAVLVGSGTALADDPALTVRRGIASCARRSVCCSTVGSACRPPPGSSPHPKSAWARSGRAARRRTGPGSYAPLADAGWRPPAPRRAGDRGAVEPERTRRSGRGFERLAEAGLTTVLVEGGGSLAAALLRADLVDEVHWMLAPKLIGGDGRAALGPLERTRLADAVSIEPIRVRRLGQDLHVHGRVRRPIERAASTRRTSRKRSRREGA